MEKVSFKKYLKERVSYKFFFISLIIYALLCLGSAIYWCVDFDLRNLMLCLAFILLVPIIFIAEHYIGFRCGELFTLGVLFIAYGSILGSCFNLYSLIPFFDTILHGTSGLIFTALGFILAEKLFGKVGSKKSFLGALLFGIFFNLTIATLWEFFEFGCTSLLGFDMMEDSIVNKINSYFLAGSHNEAVILEGITSTTIEYAGGAYVIDGYLDLGLVDTMHDMLICAFGSIVFSLLTIVGYFKLPKLNEILIPRVATRYQAAEQNTSYSEAV